MYDNIYNNSIIVKMPQEYLMNIASTMFLICYIPEFYANYRNKNANMYNVFEKIFIACGTGFGLGYSLTTNSQALIFNYSTLFTLDIIALFMRAYYAYMNHGRDTRVLLTLSLNNNSCILSAEERRRRGEGHSIHGLINHENSSDFIGKTPRCGVFPSKGLNTIEMDNKDVENNTVFNPFPE